MIHYHQSMQAALGMASLGGRQQAAE
jgi:hypothetical protein